jgi:catechol 2,3-dioxygenase-like lactoylglutathione lyase family enzyme
VITSRLDNVFTHELGGSLAFYQGVLGLPETFRTPRDAAPEHVEMAAGGFVLAVSTAEAAGRVFGVEPAVGHPAVSLVFWVDDVDTTFEAATAAGAPAVTPPHDTGNANRNAAVRAPEGTLVELVAKRS